MGEKRYIKFQRSRAWVISGITATISTDILVKKEGGKVGIRPPYGLWVAKEAGGRAGYTGSEGGRLGYTSLFILFEC